MVSKVNLQYLDTKDLIHIVLEFLTNDGFFSIRSKTVIKSTINCDYLDFLIPTAYFYPVLIMVLSKTKRKKLPNDFMCMSAYFV